MSTTAPGLNEEATPEFPRLNPWLFVPVLYFMQAVPVTIVQEVATVFYKDLGVANEPITRWTSLISLPWSLQLLLGPLVDLNGRKRSWILNGQLLIAVGLILTALLLQTPNAFEITLLILGATAVTSALCNIATDGFYILSMAKDQQAKFVGVQTTCYRLGRLFCVGLLVLFVGLLTRHRGMDVKQAWTIVLLGGGVLYGVGHLVNRATLPRPVQDQPVADADPAETRRNVLRTLLLLALGVGGFFLVNAVVRLTMHFAGPAIGAALNTDPKGWILKPDNAILIGTNRLAFGAVGTELVQLAICAGLVGAAYVGAKRLIRGTPMADALVSFVRQPGFPAILFFILFYRFGEAMVVKMSPLFLKDTIANGGLAIVNEQLGIIKGFIGVIGIILGGLAGGLVVSKYGLRKAFFPIAVLMHLPNLLYAYAAWQHTRLPLAIVELGPLGPVPMTLAGIDFAEQFGYGFGFAGYMVYLMWVAQRGKYKTTHYAVGTGMGALCIAVAGALSGVIQANFGYAGFFLAAVFLAIPGLAALFFIPMDPHEGQGKKVAASGGH